MDVCIGSLCGRIRQKYSVIRNVKSNQVFLYVHIVLLYIVIFRIISTECSSH